MQKKKKEKNEKNLNRSIFAELLWPQQLPPLCVLTQPEARGKKICILGGDGTTTKKKPPKRCHLSPQCPCCLQSQGEQQPQRKQEQKFPSSPPAPRAGLYLQSFPKQGGVAFLSQPGPAAALSLFLSFPKLSRKVCWGFFFGGKRVFSPQDYSWNPSMGASACWKMYCCWFSSTCGATAASSSTPK